MTPLILTPNERQAITYSALRRMGMLGPGETPSNAILKASTFALDSIVAQLGITSLQPSAWIHVANLLAEELALEIGVGKGRRG